MPKTLNLTLLNRILNRILNTILNRIRISVKTGLNWHYLVVQLQQSIENEVIILNIYVRFLSNVVTLILEESVLFQQLQAHRYQKKQTNSSYYLLVSQLFIVFSLGINSHSRSALFCAWCGRQRDLWYSVSIKLDISISSVVFSNQTKKWT